MEKECIKGCPYTTASATDRDKFLVEKLYPLGDKIMDTAPERGSKTTVGLALSVHVGAGEAFLGRKVEQGTVVIIDEETPLASLERWLDRFAWGLGYTGYRQLPIHIFSKEGFRFGTKNTEILSKLRDINPIYTRLDSLLSMLPSGRRGLEENNSTIGVAVRDTLDGMLTPYSTIMLAAHSKKPAALMSFEDMKQAEMVSLVRGHGGIVGEGCDTGMAIFKISQYPEPTRFVILPKPGRTAIPVGEVWVELEEESYGEGYARLKVIEPVEPAPSELELALYHLLSRQGEKTQGELRRAFALQSPRELRQALWAGINRGLVVQTERLTYYGTTTPTMPRGFREIIIPTGIGNIHV